MSRAAILLSCLMAAVAGVAVSMLLISRDPQTSPPPHTRTVNQLNIFAGSEDPVGAGGEITRAELENTLRACDVCQLPTSGAETQADIAHAWSREDGKVAIDLKDGLRIYFTPDERTEDRYMKDAESLVEERGPYSSVELRGLKALGRMRGEEAPSALLWIEDGYLVEMIGNETQELMDLTVVARSLGRATAA